MAKPVEIEILLKDRMSGGLDAVQRKLDGLMAQASGTSERISVLRTAIGALTLQLEALEKAGTPDLDQTQNIARAEQLRQKIGELQIQLQQLEDVSQNTEIIPSGMERARSQMNGLHMSIQQIAREMPSLAMGPQMFFLAISNNLPVFTDELARARREYDELTKSGQKATPVWRQVLSSLFSWQTGLTTGIMLLVMYSKDITGWVSSLFSADSAQQRAAKSARQYAESLKAIHGQLSQNVANAAASQLASYKKLQREYDALGRDMAAKQRFIDQNKEAFHNLGFAVRSVADAERLLVDNTDAVVSAIMARAKVAAYEQEITEVMRKSIEQKERNRNTIAGGGYYRPVQAGRRFYGGYGGYGKEFGDADLKPGVDYKETFGYMNQSVATLTAAGAAKLNEYRRSQAAALLKANNDAIDKATERQLASLEKQLGTASDAWKKEAGKTGVDTYDEYDIPGEKELKAVQDAADKLLALRQKNQQAEVALMEDGAARKLAQIDADYEAQKVEIEKKARELAEANKQAGIDGLTPEQQAEVDRAHELNTRTREKTEQDLYRSLSDEYQSYADKRLAIEEDFNKAIASLQAARRRAEKEGDAEAMARLDRSITQATAEKGKELMRHDFDALQRSPEYVRAFEDLRSTSTGTLQVLLARLEEAKQTAAEVFNPSDLKEYTAVIRDIMDELDARDPFGALAARQRELAEAEKELSAARRRMEAVNAGVKIATGMSTDGDGKLSVSYLSAAEALEQYNAAKDKARRASNNYVKAEQAAKEQVDSLTASLLSVGEAVGGSSGEIISLIGDVATFATSAIDGIALTARTGAESLSAVEKASVILGIASAALRVLQEISSLGNNGAFKEYEAFAERVNEMNALTDAVNQYRLATLEAQQAEEGWFAADNLQNLRDWRSLHDEVYKAYIDKASEAQAVYQNKSGGGWLTGAFNWIMGNLSALSWWDDWRDIWGQGGYSEGMTAAVNNLRIETRKASKGFLGTGIGGHSQKTEDLTTWARNQGLGELFDEEGLIDKELAQSLIDNYGDKLVGQTQETLEALIDLREQYDEYLTQLHDYVSSLYEPLVENVVDSLWDWLDSGKDALDSFKDYASDTFRDIVSDMLRTIVLDKVVGSFSDDIAAVYEEYAKGGLDEARLMEEVARRTQELLGDYERNLPALEGMLEQVAGAFEEAGINLRQPEGGYAQTGKAGAYTAMSQDQGTKLEGLWTTSAMHLSSMDDRIMDVSEQMSTAVGSLHRIEENTGNSAQHLGEIKEDIKKIIRDGLKMK